MLRVALSRPLESRCLVGPRVPSLMAVLAHPAGREVKWRLCSGAPTSCLSRPPAAKRQNWKPAMVAGHGRPESLPKPLLPAVSIQKTSCWGSAPGRWNRSVPPSHGKWLATGPLRPWRRLQPCPPQCTGRTHRACRFSFASAFQGVREQLPQKWPSCRPAPQPGPF